MYYYRIAYETREGYDTLEFTHERKFSPEEFRKIADEAVGEAFRKLLESDRQMPEKFRSWIGFCRWYELEQFIVKEMEKRGFKKVEYEAKREYRRLYIIRKPPEITEDEYGEAERLLGKELLEEIVAYNEDVERKLDEWLKRGGRDGPHFLEDRCGRCRRSFRVRPYCGISA